MLRIQALRDRVAMYRNLAEREAKPEIRQKLWTMVEQCEDLVQQVQNDTKPDQSRPKPDDWIEYPCPRA